jgi:hypothetical protein
MMMDRKGVRRALASLRHGLLVFLGLLLAASVAHAAQRNFATAEQAADALVQAVKKGDRSGVLLILGNDAAKWIFSPDDVADRAAAQHFIDQFEQKHTIAPSAASRATLTVGADDWPFAFPLVKANGRWRFDTEMGKRELLARRVGENELAVINVMQAIVDAQREYASADRNKDGVREYARKFRSDDGTNNGLYWPTRDGEAPSPLGPLMTRASAEGYSGKTPGTPYHGYMFRMLEGQGPDAPGGAQEYIVRGHMIGGFAAIAYPAQYGNTGVMTFVVNHDGVVYQKDLGRETAKLAPAMTRFDPGAGWNAVSMQ